jgi:hypothetical protein
VKQDPEIDAMSAVATALEGLDDEARARVLGWATQRFEVNVSEHARSVLPEPSNGSPSAASTGHREDGISEFVDLFDLAGPRTDAERALIGGYWFQVMGGATDFQSQQVNEVLKDVGHGVGNITDALSKLQRRKPALVRQVAKSGRTRQARKKYKITAAGVAAAREMLARGELE